MMFPRDSNQELFDKNKRGVKRKQTFSAEEENARKWLWHRFFNKYAKLSEIEFQDCRVSDICEAHFSTKHFSITSVESTDEKELDLETYHRHVCNFVEKVLLSPMKQLLLNRSVCISLNDEKAKKFWHKKVKKEIDYLKETLSMEELGRYIKICDTNNRTIIERIWDEHFRSLGIYTLELREKNIPEQEILNLAANFGKDHNVSTEGIVALMEAMFFSNSQNNDKNFMGNNPNIQLERGTKRPIKREKKKK